MVQVPFTMDGKFGILDYMMKRLKKNGICVVVIAEGAGQVHFGAVAALVANVNLYNIVMGSPIKSTDLRIFP